MEISKAQFTQMTEEILSLYDPLKEALQKYLPKDAHSKIAWQYITTGMEEALNCLRNSMRKDGL